MGLDGTQIHARQAERSVAAERFQPVNDSSVAGNNRITGAGHERLAYGNAQHQYFSVTHLKVQTNAHFS